MTVPLRDDPLLTEIPVIDGFKVLDPCVLYSKLGEGGMGAVYRGRHLNLDIDVAVKCLRRSLAEQGATFVQRFQREARLAAGIHHQNLVQVYDVSQKSGVHYLVMEFVSGETARDRVRRKGRLALAEALRIALGAAGGLAEAHARRIVHRDVKPDNVLISREGHVKVSDLGLAKALESEVELTLSQAVMGTPLYMAPEQWEDSSRVTPAADVWALGATLYFLLAGADPIQGGTLQQVMRRICLEPFPDVRKARPDVSEPVARLIERCVARAPEERFADCRALLDELKPLVGRDQGELVSRPGETTRMGATLVSPPPPETLTRIRLEIQSRDGSRPGAPAKAESRGAAAPPSPGAPGSPRARRTQLALALAGSTALGALALFLVLRDGGSPPSAPVTETTAPGGAPPPAVDARAPALDSPAWDPAGPLRHGTKASLTLRFDETLESAEIDGHGAKVDGATARATLRAPEKGERWDVSWRAVDRAGNAATGSLSVALAAPPATAASQPPDPRTAPPPAGPETRVPPPAPKGCVAVGGEALELDGQRWAKRIRHERTGIQLVLVPPGEFVMGSTEDLNAPAPRTVAIRRAFYLSENEVSEAEYARGMDEPAPAATAQLPERGLSWDDANRFCRKVKLELPREAEWEYACRAGSSTRFAFGSELAPGQGSTARHGGQLQPCGSSERNRFGLADVHGNLKEFCADEYLAPAEYAKLPATDPLGKRGKGRVVRGGSYASQPEYCASAARQPVEEGKKLPDAGLRVLLRIE